MINKRISISILILCFALTLFSQNVWSVDEDYIKHNTESLFLNGVNYVPSQDWMFMLERWDETQAEKDIIGMKSLGVKCVRFFPLWNIVQPTPNLLDEKIMQRIDRILDLGAKHGLYYQITPITGWMSGGTFLPDWALGNIFTDPEIIKGEIYLVKQFAKRYKDHPALQGFDFGNEINVLVDQMKLNVTPEEIDLWMQKIYKAFKEEAPDCIVTNGIGTGFDPYFNIEAISRSCDYMSVHSYPYFHGTYQLDPSIGQRTLYSGNFITEWAAMMNKPVLMQENGTTRPGIRAAKGLRIYYLSSWAEGAAGYFWWGSHILDPDYYVESPGLRKEYSVDPMKKGDLRGDRTMGFLSNDNQPEISGLEYEICTEWVDQIGVDWKDIQPVCYIIMPHTTEFYETMLKFINPFVLAKQAHFDVKLLWEDQEVPEDAAAVFISGFQLSSTGKKKIGKYLKGGGNVYQSFYNDFSLSITADNSKTLKTDSVLTFTTVDKDGEISKHSFKTKEIDINPISKLDSKSTSLSSSASTVEGGKEVDPFFIKTSIGKGNYYHLSLNLEEYLGMIRNPWAADNSYLFYKELMPETVLKIDNKLVEFYHKKRKNDELIVLINHEDSPQNVILNSRNPIAIENAINGLEIGKGTEINFQLEAAEALLINVLR